MLVKGIQLGRPWVDVAPPQWLLGVASPKYQARCAHIPQHMEMDQQGCFYLRCWCGLRTAEVE